MSNNTALLVKYSTNQGFQPRKKDDRATREVYQAYNIKSTTAGSFMKNLIDPVHIKPITQAFSKIRKHYYAMSVPWDNDGRRLMDSANFLKLQQIYAEIKQNELDPAVDTFIMEYEKYVVQAREDLQGLFDPKDYPPSSQLVFKDGFEFEKLPEENDLSRLGVSQHYVEEQVELAKTRLETAHQEMYRKIFDVVSHLAKIASAPDAKIFDTAITHVDDAVEVLENLNVLNDPVLQNLLDNTADLMKGITKDRLKSDPNFREKAGKDLNETAAEIERKYAGVFFEPLQGQEAA